MDSYDATAISAPELAARIGPSTLRNRSGGPLYLKIADELRRLIESGEVSAQTRLPAERALSISLDVSRVTVASAYRHLRESGWISAQRGSGTYVSPTGSLPSWGSLAGDRETANLEFVNASPSASPLLSDAYGVAAEKIRDRFSLGGYAPSGLFELREAIAAYYRARGVPTTADNVLVTSGATDAIHAVLATFTEPGARVLVEHPTYPGVVELVHSLGGRCIPVPIDPDDTDEFVTSADRATRQSAPTLAYFMPDFSNPSGARLPLRTRRQLSATMHRHAVLTIVDEVAADLSLVGSPDIEPFGAATPDVATVTIGSTSKTVWGGLRVGWVRAEAGLLTRIAATYARRQLSVSVIDQLAAVELMGKYDEVRRVRAEASRVARDHTVAVMRDQLPDWHFRIPDGGLALWCSLPDGIRSSSLVAEAHSHGLLLAPGLRFGTGYAFDDHQRIPFTRSLPDISSAVEILAGLSSAGTPAPTIASSRPAAVV
ncbi:aspartate aminotransferase [Rhodococcus sp. 06-470-2]|uniref:aminotransferase-like domain-containing protein n=1 Tax=unclassified Rhodococcus (in: high G+C Gram-positive bacteria) TaxID=192944 RepID=UPI000B9ADBAE|nr:MULTISPECIES: PLP-dependent aminotransferase family protein [unclassified Rhodococcus (in: high G+C Gram-positive bacteria)]OZC67770.1 aspartate aminotransferase [Rhodococcus sp. 06-470-2]OZE62287.1 aspartate aminotransferase [Rhodococcus sp. 05-2221-1B]OZE62921.1 aspartate aminotransferase [Rhodococcus sp. 05-2221-1B]